MSWFSTSKRREGEVVPSAVETLTEAAAVTAAKRAREQDDWAVALMSLERVKDRSKAGAEFQELRKWALTAGGRRGDRDRWQRLKLDGAALDVSPEDAMAYTHLLHQVKPDMILEVGSRGGGLAHWLIAQCQGLGLQTTVHSADWGLPAKSSHPMLYFWGGDLRKPSGIWPGTLMKHLPASVLVILRTAGGHDITWSALRSLHKWLGKGAVICVESEPDSNPDSKPEDKRTSAHALWRFAARHPVEYGLLPGFHQQFGPDGLRTSLHGLRHTGLAPMDPAASPGLDAVRALMEKENWNAALEDLNARKATRKPQPGVDYLRGLCFAAQGLTFSVCEAAKEELRYHPGHPHAEALLSATMHQLFPGTPKLGGPGFHEIYHVIRNYTMLSDERLYSIYLRVRLVCEMDVPGDIVECGVAAGGASALMAAVVARHSKRPRKVFSCDTFEGMPTPTAKDMHGSTDAEASGWGSGTCSAPPGSLLEVAQKLGVANLVEPVKGLFCDTLPGLKDRLPHGIAFLHMDGDWYESTRDILVSLYAKVHPRGFIQVDDYGYWEGCREAMHDYAREHGIEFKVNVIDGTGVWLQRPDRAAADQFLLNLGCGSHYHPAWINLDIAPSAPEVIAHDLAREPLPFDAGTCAAVYHSHVLEHIPPHAVKDFLSECHRVLQVGGVLRIAVPDLEGIAREYLKQLDARDHEKHEWMIHELVDQLARHYSGGRMMDCWRQNPMPAEDFVFQRVGWEAAQFVKQFRAAPAVEVQTPQLTPESVGRFRLSGEVHQWMYDRLSLERLLTAVGFTDVKVCTATQSAVAGFASHHLDADAESRVRKPDSLFVEAIKPATA